MLEFFLLVAVGFVGGAFWALGKEAQITPAIGIVRLLFLKLVGGSPLILPIGGFLAMPNSTDAWPLIPIMFGFAAALWLLDGNHAECQRLLHASPNYNHSL
ncbi:hypothetical protein C4553_03370 [Candidatus Parcubacteria bacterium]|nr:MAG: hypothetical protein C4553_03370 [Candidatus Parcubacteria bacterium]